MFSQKLISFPRPQVESNGEDAVTVPDHEVITRRKQFRMKRDVADQKKEKGKRRRKRTKKRRRQRKKGKC